LIRRLRDTEVDDLGNRDPVLHRYQDIGWFDISVDDSPLMRMMDGLTYGNKQPESLGGGQAVPVAVLGNRNSGDVLHDEVRSALRRCTRIEHLCDVGMV